MGIGISIFLIAVGAILAFGVDVAVQGLDLTTVGVILMIVGGIGLFVDMLILGDNGPRFGTRSRRTTVVRNDPRVVSGGPVIAEPVNEVEYRRVEEY